MSVTENGAYRIAEPSVFSARVPTQRLLTSILDPGHALLVQNIRFISESKEKEAREGNAFTKPKVKYKLIRHINRVVGTD
ncbi:unnamed protein product [Sphenostylis stenocarpa]|uniref:Uncharacterized protein n=1 Tax=Sphenostylis stenocarpa TaxID=92480 RepID=A0AA86SBD6_9FABA|nr:unnamed protein product [Sphenostylis stenocarpa]